VSGTDRKSSIPPEVGDLRKITIQGIATGIRELEYEAKGLSAPDEAELLRMAEERYESSIKNGPDDHLGSGKK